MSLIQPLWLSVESQDNAINFTPRLENSPAKLHSKCRVLENNLVYYREVSVLDQAQLYRPVCSLPGERKEWPTCNILSFCHLPKITFKHLPITNPAVKVYVALSGVCGKVGDHITQIKNLARHFLI